MWLTDRGSNARIKATRIMPVAVRTVNRARCPPPTPSPRGGAITPNRVPRTSKKAERTTAKRIDLQVSTGLLQLFMV
jgi:hypothetical protein